MVCLDFNSTAWTTDLKIDFTKQEYRLLLDVVFIADWILTSHDVEEPSDDDPYQMLFQKVYSYAEESGFRNLVAAAPELNRYYPTKEYEDANDVFDRIEEYDAMNFWEELIERFTDRDVYGGLPDDARDRLDTEEFWKRAAPYEQKYAAEFEKHGIERLVIDDSQS